VLQQRNDGREMAPTYSENSSWRTGAMTRIDAFYLNDKAAEIFDEYQTLSSLDVKKHRPLLLTLKTGNLDQLIEVAKAPDPYPVDSMRSMKPADEEKIGRKVVEEQREAIEECLRAVPPDTVRLFPILSGVAEKYLERRTMGASGKPGKPGRGGAPQTTSVPLQPAAKVDSLGEANPEIRHLKKQRGRAADLRARFRRAEVATYEEVQRGEEGAVEEELIPHELLEKRPA